MGDEKGDPSEPFDIGALPMSMIYASNFGELEGAKGISRYFQLFLPQSMYLDVAVEHAVMLPVMVFP